MRFFLMMAILQVDMSTIRSFLMMTILQVDTATIRSFLMMAILQADLAILRSFLTVVSIISPYSSELKILYSCPTLHVSQTRPYPQTGTRALLPASV